MRYYYPIEAGSELWWATTAVNYVLDQMGNKNLDVSTSVHYPGKLNTIKTAIDNIITNFNKIIDRVL